MDNDLTLAELDRAVKRLSAAVGKPCLVTSGRTARSNGQRAVWYRAMIETGEKADEMPSDIVMCVVGSGDTAEAAVDAVLDKWNKREKSNAD